MSVLACVRRDCDSIMCDTYIPNVGYLCRECQQEFKAFLARTEWLETEGEIVRSLTKFIDTSKNDKLYKLGDIDIDKFFNKYTK